MQRSNLIGYEFDYANASTIAISAWNDNLNSRVSLHSVLTAAGETDAVKEYADTWRLANAFRKAHGKRRLAL